MPCSEAFWHAFWPTLGTVLGLLPLLGAVGSIIAAVIYWQDRDARRAAANLGPRIAYLEGRLLPFDEARRQRERAGG
jgi:hypothetical protein